MFQCLSLKPTPEAYEQVSVSTTIGGLGIRRIVDHARGAFTASWYEGQGVTHETWIKPPDKDCSDVYETQKSASSKVDVAIMSHLKESATLRDVQRLNRVDSPHANAWLSARPSSMDGSDCILSPKIFRTAVSRLLGQPVSSSSVPCPLCKQTMDIYGDHALCCGKSGDRITRHNRLRNVVFKLADTGLLSPDLEKLGILGVTDKTRRRPGDVSIKNWTLRRGLAIDVAVICPLATSHLREAEPCESYAIRKSTDMAMLLRILTTILLLSFSRRVEQLTKRVKTFSSRSFGLLPSERVLPTLFMLLEPGLDCLVVFSMLVLSKS